MSERGDGESRRLQEDGEWKSLAITWSITSAGYRATDDRLMAMGRRLGAWRPKECVDDC